MFTLNTEQFPHPLVFKAVRGGGVSVLLYTVCTYVHVHCPACVWGGGVCHVYVCHLTKR
jgi:hypothetical protein